MLGLSMCQLLMCLVATLCATFNQIMETKSPRTPHYVHSWFLGVPDCLVGVYPALG